MPGSCSLHCSTESLLREACRNPALLEIYGFEALPRQSRSKYFVGRDPETGKCRAEVRQAKRRSTVPSSWNMSRFRNNLKALEAESGLVGGLLAELRHRLMDEVDDFGERVSATTARLLKAIRAAARTATVDRLRIRMRPGGWHEYKWIDENAGEPRSKKKTWFGCRMHVIADTNYEMPLAVSLALASRRRCTRC